MGGGPGLPCDCTLYIGGPDGGPGLFKFIGPDDGGPVPIPKFCGGPLGGPGLLGGIPVEGTNAGLFTLGGGPGCKEK
jgi:hypothetical protein